MDRFVSAFLALSAIVLCNGCAKIGAGPTGQQSWFLSGQNLAGGEKNLLDDGTPSPFVDSFHSGIPDRFNPDIKGCGFPNLVDQYPYDPTKGTEDVNHDGIPDWVEFEVNGVLKPGETHQAAVLQLQLFREFNVFAISDDRPFLESELKIVYDELKTGALRSFPRAKTPWVLIRKASPGGVTQEFGSYNPYWRGMWIFADSDRFLETFLHENFHRLASERPDVYQNFVELSGWTEGTDADGEKTYTFQSPQMSQPVTISEFDLKNNMGEVAPRLVSDDFPSDYSKSGPEEMFAECGTAASLAWTGRTSPRYAGSFQTTSLYSWFVGVLAQKN